MVLEGCLESPLDCKEIESVNHKWNQSWMFIGRTDAEAEAPIILPPDTKNWLIGEDTDAGKDWRQEEKRMTDSEMVGITNLMEMSLSKLWKLMMNREACHASFHGVAKSWTQLSDWTELMDVSCLNNWPSFPHPLSGKKQRKEKKKRFFFNDVVVTYF